MCLRICFALPCFAHFKAETIEPDDIAKVGIILRITENGTMSYNGNYNPKKWDKLNGPIRGNACVRRGG